MLYTDINQVLQEEELRPGAVYRSPAHLVNYQKHAYGTPYWQQPGGIPLQTMLSVTVSTPERERIKGINFYPINQSQQTAVKGYGQAPTNGIYTGVEDVCNG